MARSKAAGFTTLRWLMRPRTPVTGLLGGVTAFSRHPTQPLLYGNDAYARVAEIDMVSGSVVRTFDTPGFAKSKTALTMT